jgi:REP element-mobilizing transposase RayT
VIKHKLAGLSSVRDTPLDTLAVGQTPYTRYPLYFVTTNTKDRRSILSNERVHDEFGKFCKAGLARGVVVGKYVIMPDHLHLFARSVAPAAIL